MSKTSNTTKREQSSGRVGSVPDASRPSPDASLTNSTSGGVDQPYQFSFVDVNSKDARKIARSHVMREFMAKKRVEEDQAPAKAMRRQSSHQSDDSERVQHDSIEQSQLSLELPRSSRKASRKRSSEVLGSDDDDAAEVYQRQLVARQSQSSSRSQSPTGPLDGRGDPFQTLPLRLDKEDFGLVDHYITVVPELMCNFKGMRLRSGVTAKSFNPTRDIILPQAMNNPITFQATALAFAAGHLARLHGKTNTPNSQKHRVQTLRKLREHFFGQKTHSDDLDIMVAVLSLASCEDRFGENARAWIHMRGCVAMLEKLLGTLDWKKDRRLSTYMNWVLITMTGYDSCAVKVLEEKTRPAQLSFLTHNQETASSTVSPDVNHTKQAIGEFIQFLDASYGLNRQRENLPGTSTRLGRRSTMFLPGSSIHKLLTSIPGTRPGVRSTNIQKACRFACLVFLNAMLLELSSSPEVLEEYLKRLSIRMIEQELDWNESTEALTWLLLFGDETGDDAYKQTVMVWWVGRMTNVAKRLSDDSWSSISKEMIGSLAQEDDNEGEAVFRRKLSGWQQELMEAPLAWWPEPDLPSIENG